MQASKTQHSKNIIFLHFLWGPLTYFEYWSLLRTTPCLPTLIFPKSIIISIIIVTRFLVIFCYPVNMTTPILIQASIVKWWNSHRVLPFRQPARTQRAPDDLFWGNWLMMMVLLLLLIMIIIIIKRGISGHFGVSKVGRFDNWQISCWTNLRAPRR